jgi:hypothetical protein
MRFASVGIFLLLLTAVSLLSQPILAAEPPVVPIGLDAYRQWDRWPYQRIGVRAYMRSTYDRSSRNEGADAGHFLYQLADDNNVTLDVAGSGILYFARYNHWHGSPWHYVVDGTDHIVQESTTADPTKRVPNSVFMPQSVFPSPLVWTWSATKGADLSWVPIPFEHSFSMAYARTKYSTGYYIYQQFTRGIPLSQPIKAWDGNTLPDKDVLDLINRAGTDIAPSANMAGFKSNRPCYWKRSLLAIQQCCAHLSFLHRAIRLSHWVAAVCGSHGMTCRMLLIPRKPTAAAKPPEPPSSP